MAMFVLNDADGIGSDDIDSNQAFVDLVIIADDDGIGLDDPVNGLQLVTYARTGAGAVRIRMDDLVNTTFTPDYGSGAQQVDTIIIPALAGFTLDDGSSFTNNGTALPPAGSGLPGAGLNTTDNCLVIYDTEQNICVARDDTGGDIDLSISNPVVLYHEFSHAFRIVNNTLLALTAECDPASPEENSAIIDENDLRTELANRQGETPELRDPDIHCGSVGCSSGCCIIATVASRSLTAPQVQQLRYVRDHYVRSTDVGFAFFEQLFHDYYSFSPQVCTMMAGNPQLSDHLLEGYVSPLLTFWEIMIERSHHRFTDAELGAAFVARHEVRGAAEARLDALRRTVGYWHDGEAVVNDESAALIDLLRQRAWPSEYVQWALVAPVRIYAEVLGIFVDGADEEDIGKALSDAIAAWAPYVPISETWASLPTQKLQAELALCDSRLLQSQASERLLRQRLFERFSDITAIRASLGHLTTEDATDD